jgi:O-antigen/teichoic acid export membrane protein
MSLQRNIVANLASQVYVTLIGILMVPMYVRYMGAEAYGLVGFFAMLQAWFNLLDIGLTPTVARETARLTGGAMPAADYRRLLRALEAVFVTVALLGAAVMLLASTMVADGWLRAEHLPASEVIGSLQLMALTVVLRWMSGLYRGVISGFERIVWLSGFNAAVATLRFCGVLPLLMIWSVPPTQFFAYQLVVAALEFGALLFFAYRLLPALPAGIRLRPQLAPLKPVLKFSLSIAFTSSVWVFVTQTDKLVLSRILPLAEYGYFTAAVLVASGILILSGPVSTAILPRMAKLEAQGLHAQLIDVYRQGTQLVVVIAGALAATLAVRAEPLLWAWTGNRELAEQASPVLALYAIGNGVLAVSAFPYYLQYAKGNLRLHLIGNAIFVTLLVPLVVWAANRYGGTGAGVVWLATNLLSFALWLPFVHQRFAPQLNRSWYGRDVLTIWLAIAAAAWAMNQLLPDSQARLPQVVEVIVLALVVLLAGATASSVARLKLRSLLSR